MPELWEFLLAEWVPALYEEDWYNTGDTALPCPDGSRGAPCKRSPDDNNVLYDNKLLGVPRFRQLRLTNNSCDVHPAFESNIKENKDNIDGLNKMDWLKFGGYYN